MNVLENVTRKEAPSWVSESHDILRSVSELTSKNNVLKEKNQRLKNDLHDIEEQLIRCPITGLFNFAFFKDYLTAKLASSKEDTSISLLIINIDNMANIRFSYGDNEVDEVLTNTMYFIKDLQNNDSSMLFRLQGATFAWCFQDVAKAAVIEKAERLRYLVSTSKSYIEKITLSIGVAFSGEIKALKGLANNSFESIYELAMQRVNLANTNGYNMVCSHSSVEDYKGSSAKILIIDIDEVNLDVLQTKFENLKYQVLTTQDGESALALAKSELPDVIISEIMLPQKDAFMIREELLMQSETKKIPFFMVSHLKNEDSVEQALSLGIEHYLQKPLMLSELIGIIQLKIKGDNY